MPTVKTDGSGTNARVSGAEKSNRDVDLYAWLLHQARELRLRQPEFLDWGELAEELDEIVALARKEVVSRLATVLAHLLKWKYQAARRHEASWRNTIARERVELSLLLDDSRNLRNYLESEGYARAYSKARVLAGNEMQLARERWERLFPAACEWNPSQALNDDFFPPLVPKTNGKRT